MRVLVLDTETTGLPIGRNAPVTTPALWPYIVQFSYIIFNTDTNTLDQASDYIVKLPEDVTIEPDSTEIHGITNEMSAMFGVSISNALSPFLEDIDKVDLVVAHNMEFDRNVILAELIRLRSTYEMYSSSYTYLDGQIMRLVNSPKLFCTMQESVEMCNIIKMNRYKKPYAKFPTLTELHVHLFGLTLQKLHNSLNDVVICFRCFYKLKFGTDIYFQNEAIKKMIDPLLVEPVESVCGPTV